MKKRILILSLGLCGAVPAIAQYYSPVAVTGYNQDVIAETSPAMSSTTGSLDGSDYVLYSQAYGTVFSTGYGLPDNGLIVNGVRSYQLAPFDQPNTLSLLTGETDSLDLVTPASYAALSLLGFSTEGPGQILAVVKFTDGSAAVFNSQPLPDWFDGTSAMITGFDRAGRTTNSPDFINYAPSMYAINMLFSCADQAKTIRSVMIINTTSSPVIRTSVFALSGVPVLNAGIISEDISCNGQVDGSVTASANNTGVGPYSYSWTGGQTTAALSGLAPGSYTVTIQDSYDCTSTETVTITEPTALSASVTTTTNNSCHGEAEGTATVAATGGTGAYTYSWTAGGGSAATASGLSAGNYTVTVTDENGCTASPAAVVITEPAAINVSVTASGLTLTAAATGAAYQWLNCAAGSSEIAGASASAFTATANGSYAVEITQGGCADTSACFAITTVSVEENIAETFSMYPNPASGSVTFQLEGTIAELTLIDLSGRKHEAVLNGKELDIRSLNAGAYLVYVTDEKGNVRVAQLTVY